MDLAVPAWIKLSSLKHQIKQTVSDQIKKKYEYIFVNSIDACID